MIFADEEPLLEASELGLIGPHNADNAMAAAAAALAMGLGRDAVREGLRGFAGLPHRLERVAERGGVLYVNDSKATNVAAAAAALRSFDGGVRAILGGSLKGQDFTGLVEPVRERCVACYLIGEAAEPLGRDLEPARDAGVELRRCEGLAAAVRAAAADARAGEVVLLSPACASFDAYRDFEQRGEHFRSLVEGLDASTRKVRACPARTTREMTALSLSRLGPKTRRRAGAQPIEYSLLLTATLCLLAFGVVMVFSASSTTLLLGAERRQRLLPEADPAVRRRRPARDAGPVAARDARAAAR